MVSTVYYDSPLGRILLAANEKDELTGLWFEGQQYYPENLQPEVAGGKLPPVLGRAADWLDGYFAGRAPAADFALAPEGSEFQKSVWALLQKIPYGQTVTYGELARQLAAQQGRAHVSAQAVGGAVGHNRLSIIIPCHRVVGADGSLTGYAGGIERKVKLLQLEKADMSGLFVPKKGTTL